MESFGTKSDVGLARTNVTQESVSSVFKMGRSRELGTTLVVTNNVIVVPSSFQSEEGGDTFFRNVSSNKTHMAPHPRR
jgi:hypothetical protein